MSKRSNSSHKIRRFFQGPARLLSGTMDLYVDIMKRCSGVRFHHAGNIPGQLPRSKSEGFNRSSTSAGNRHIAGLNRAGSLTRKIPLGGGTVKSEDVTAAAKRIRNLMVITTIHEDRSSHFDDDEKMDEIIEYSRSRSCVVVGRRRKMMLA